MPASRWNSNILEMLNWLYEEQAGLEELMAQQITPRIIQNDSSGDQNIPQPDDLNNQLPKVLPVLPLRGLVVFPQTAVPLTIGQSRSIRLVDDAMASDKLIAKKEGGVAWMIFNNPERLNAISLEMWQAADAMVMGRKTYEGLAAVWPPLAIIFGLDFSGARRKCS